MQNVFMDMFTTEFTGANSEELLGGILTDGNINENSLNSSLKRIQTSLYLINSYLSI